MYPIKAIITSVLLMLASCISFAQGISVKGVEIEGDIYEFVNKLIEKGLEHESSNKPIKSVIDEAIQRNSPIYLKGKLMDSSAIFKVYYTRKTLKAYMVSVSFSREFFTLESAREPYTIYKKRLTEKYGKPKIVRERVFNENSFTHETQYFSTFTFKNDEVRLSLRKVFRYNIEITYTNSTNAELNETEKEALYQEEI